MDPSDLLSISKVATLMNILNQHPYALQPKLMSQRETSTADSAVGDAAPGSNQTSQLAGPAIDHLPGLPSTTRFESKYLDIGARRFTNRFIHSGTMESINSGTKMAAQH